MTANKFLPESAPKPSRKLLEITQIGMAYSENATLQQPRTAKTELITEPRKKPLLQRTVDRHCWCQKHKVWIVMMMMIIWVKLCIVCGVERPRTRGLGSLKY